MSDQKPPKYRQNWKPTVMDWTAILQAGESACLYCLTDAQVTAILGILEPLAWTTRWENFEGTPDELRAFKAGIEDQLMQGVCGNDDYITALFNDLVKRAFDEWAAQWTGTPSSINGATPDDYYNGDGSAARDDALCTACRAYVYSQANNFINQAGLAGFFVSATAAVVIATTGIGVIPCLLVAAYALLSQTAVNAMSDESAINDVVCCMVDGLTGQDVTQANFETSLDGCGFTSGSNAAIVRDIIAADLDVQGNWFAFLDVLGNAFVLAQAGVVDCPCGDVPCSSYDMTTQPPDTMVEIAGNFTPEGFGNALYSIGGNTVVGGILNWDFPSGLTISRVSMTYKCDNPRPTGVAVIIGYDSMDNEIFRSTGYDTGTHTIEHDAITSVTIYKLRTRTQTNGSTGDSLQTEVKFCFP